MSKQTYDTLQAIIALDDLDGILVPEQREEIEGLADMFKPYAGDPPEAARKRKRGLPLHCPNCGHMWDGPFDGVEVWRFAVMGVRLAACPRCYNTEDIRLGRP